MLPIVWKAVKINMKAMPKILMLRNFRSILKAICTRDKRERVNELLKWVITRAVFGRVDRPTILVTLWPI